MGNQPSIKKVNFEDIQNILQQKGSALLINTLQNNPHEQYCIIPTTINYSQEESIINNYLAESKDKKIIVYGKNAHDIKVYEKYNQLLDLGFVNVYVYPGGMFEWMLLQEIYTSEHFPTTNKELDILKFKPESLLKTKY
jgi:rhodanese-related sulfurtransferase